MSDKLAVLKKMVEEASKQEITMVYLDEEDSLQCVTRPFAGEPTEGDWVKLMDEADLESWRVFEVLSIDSSDGRVIMHEAVWSSEHRMTARYSQP